MHGAPFSRSRIKNHLFGSTKSFDDPHDNRDRSEGDGKVLVPELVETRREIGADDNDCNDYGNHNGRSSPEPEPKLRGSVGSADKKQETRNKTNIFTSPSPSPSPSLIFPVLSPFTITHLSTAPNGPLRV
ncbi:hypothetical protein D9757_014370 [Collybiopsis confluens]|uniref:Uncharacterized protein n=1 Tax=Collybiopsis confluens TaxID=2823264 RepID=A0A8H5LIK4_9AGAR|nr:hypothetical protein D9757_014370 [Collybiopsis confluens]